MSSTTELLIDHSAPARGRDITIWTRPYSYQQWVIITRRNIKKANMNNKGERTEI